MLLGEIKITHVSRVFENDTRVSGEMALEYIVKDKISQLNTAELKR